jgi:hypothetical protein
MIAAVYPGTRISEIPAEAEVLHLVRPVKKKLLEAILKKCSGLEKITLSASCLKRMPEASVALLREKGIGLQAEKRQGRAISVPLQSMLHALEMRRDHQSLREIERVTQIPKSTVHYLERYSKRAKVKNGKRVIYLK